MTDQHNPIIEKLFSAGAHYGYGKSRRHPSVETFLFGMKGSVEIFDLERTAEMLDKALAFIGDIAAKRENILFVGSKAEVRGALEHIAVRLNQPYVASRWIGGTLTNWPEIKRRLGRLTELADMREKGEVAKFTKLERLLLEREEHDLETMFGGLRGMSKLPVAMFVIDPRREKIAVTEATKLGIPVIALLNTDCDARQVAYPIPANDASRHTAELVLEEVARAFEAGLAKPAPLPPTPAEKSQENAAA